MKAKIQTNVAWQSGPSSQTLAGSHWSHFSHFVDQTFADSECICTTCFHRVVLYLVEAYTSVQCAIMEAKQQVTTTIQEQLVADEQPIIGANPKFG